MEFHFLGKGRWGHEALKGGFAHLLDVHELHVAGDHVRGVADHGIRVFQAGEDCRGHLRAEGFVTVEADAAIGIDGLCGRLGDIVEEGGEAEGEWCVWLEHFEHDAGVGEDVAFGMPLGRLLAADEGEDFWEKMVDQRGGDEKLEPSAAVG